VIGFLSWASIQKYIQDYLQNFPASPLEVLAWACIFKSIIEAHDGKVWAQNNNGHGKSGATFSFSLPLALTPRSS
jgi:hypothetical protein